MEEEIVVFFIFGGGAAFLLSVSPIGRAIADRIRGRGHDPQHAIAELDARILELRESVHDALEQYALAREQLTDLGERLDFTERLLTKGRELETEADPSPNPTQM